MRRPPVPVSVPVLLLAAGLATGCVEPQCEVLSDCNADQICVDGLCHNRAGGRFPIDSGIRRDSGVLPDTGAPIDAGLEDSGVAPAGDAGAPMDAGANADAGAGPLPSAGELGFVWAGELLDSPDGSAYHAFGLLQRLDGATFDAREEHFADGEGTTCLLSVRRQIGGTIVGFEAQEISVIPGPQPFSPFSMYPVGSGRFEPGQEPVERIYNKSRSAYFQIFGTGNDGSVESMLVGVGAPPFVFEDPAFPRGTQIAIVPSPQLRWRPSDLSDGMVTVEIFDSVREVVLTCTTIDDGAYMIPTDAVSAFLDTQPMPTVLLEIRYDREAQSLATIQGGGSLLVTYRASQGLRYPVNLP
jgi:hypothetical protein